MVAWVMALAMAGWMVQNLPLIVVGGLVVLIGLLVIGRRDVRRFSGRRLWAISGVVFDESIRRRVLWLTPVAILGIIAVTQLQRPLDEQDAIRQTTKVCLFATGFLVTTAIIILACTNLPREIENRVIYTIVTKPTTRLELVVGKVVGFARVAAAILLIMGLFTYGYLHLQAWQLQRNIAQRLTAGNLDPGARLALEHYRDSGLLNARAFGRPADLQMYARPPKEGDVTWMSGGSEHRMLVPFDLKRQDLAPVAGAGAPPGSAGFGVMVRLGYDAERPLTPTERDQLLRLQAATQPASQPTREHPTVAVEVLNERMQSIVQPFEINNGQNVPLRSMSGGQPGETLALVSPQAAMIVAERWLDDQQPHRIYIQVTGTATGVDYAAYPKPLPVTLYVPSLDPQREPGREIEPMPGRSGTAVRPHFIGRMGTRGPQLRGAKNNAPVAVYAFRDVTVPSGQKVDFEMRRVAVERSDDESTDSEVATDVTLEFVNRTSKQSFPAVLVHPENSRPTYFTVPAEAVAGGNFDVLVRAQTEGHWLGLYPDSLALVSRNQPFAVNLFKSLLVLWLMAVLVVIISIFCSTFLSWPIAVVLTLLLLLGRWGVQQLDIGSAGLGASIVTDLQLTGSTQAQVVTRSVGALSWVLGQVTGFLPDISRFSATEDIERGIAIPLQTLAEALAVLGGFGLPMLVLAYLFLKNKEVAP